MKRTDGTTFDINWFTMGLFEVIKDCAINEGLTALEDAVMLYV